MGNASIGAIIKSRRERVGLTQAQLAEKVDISRHVVGFYEQGIAIPGDDTLKKICRVLHMPERYKELMALKHPEHAAVFQKQEAVHNEECEQIIRILVNAFKQLPDEAQQRYLQMIRIELQVIEKERANKKRRKKP